MKIHQLSLFLENKPGQMAEPCRLLARAGINIRTLSLADTQHFGILRLIVSDWQQRPDAAGAGRLPGQRDRSGGGGSGGPARRPGASCWNVFDGTGVNIEYMYAFPFGRQDRAVLIFRFDRPDAAIEHLLSGGVAVLAGIQ